MALVQAIILAAGKGTRMKSDLVKVMHPLGERPMLSWPIAAARGAGADRIVLVVGHQAPTIQATYGTAPDLAFAEQTEQLGTGHAVAAARDACSREGNVLILCGDVPLIRATTLQALLAYHHERNATVTVMTTHLANPAGYGRVVKREGGRIIRIVEEKDASPDEREINEINAGIYCVRADFLFNAVANLKNDNAQGEYYLTDIIAAAHDADLSCLAFPVMDSLEVMGVNDRVQLAHAAAVIRQRINDALMRSGVTIIDPSATYIAEGVSIGRDTVVYPNTHISGQTVIGCHCRIEPSVSITDCTIGDRVAIKAGSVLAESTGGDEVAIGPMAHLRPGSQLGDHVKIGNFVETKKIVMGEGSKASHLTYLGDAEIGADVNIGCGTITCNYDGVRKHKTVIGDSVFVGSDVQLVAPVTVGANSLIAAGTTVTQDVPPDSLAISRTPQTNKVGWKLRKKDS
jgi:bifunctional UDP-N-acetylglucosamine pyrophosphorylase/glucosamine-1-phosphate N-acetyltransferase